MQATPLSNRHQTASGIFKKRPTRGRMRHRCINSIFHVFPPLFKLCCRINNHTIFKLPNKRRDISLWKGITLAHWNWYYPFSVTNFIKIASLYDTIECRVILEEKVLKIGIFHKSPCYHQRNLEIFVGNHGIIWYDKVYLKSIFYIDSRIYVLQQIEKTQNIVRFIINLNYD